MLRVSGANHQPFRWRGFGGTIERLTATDMHSSGACRREVEERPRRGATAPVSFASHPFAHPPSASSVRLSILTPHTKSQGPFLWFQPPTVGCMVFITFLPGVTGDFNSSSQQASAGPIHPPCSPFFYCSPLHSCCSIRVELCLWDLSQIEREPLPASDIIPFPERPMRARLKPPSDWGVPSAS